MIVCPRCSKENQDHYKFCLGCGAELPRDAAKKEFIARNRFFQYSIQFFLLRDLIRRQIKLFCQIGNIALLRIDRNFVVRSFQQVEEIRSISSRSSGIRTLVVAKVNG